VREIAGNQREKIGGFLEWVAPAGIMRPFGRWSIDEIAVRGNMGIVPVAPSTRVSNLARLSAVEKVRDAAKLFRLALVQ
jgi:hypothetical protein